MAPKVVIPQSPEELTEILADSGKLAEIFADKESMTDFMTSYSRNIIDKDHTFALQLREQVQLGMGEFMKANGLDKGSLPVTMTAAGPKLAGPDIRRVSLGRARRTTRRPPEPAAAWTRSSTPTPSSSRRSGRGCRRC